MKIGPWARIGFSIGLLGPAVIGVPWGVGLFEALVAGLWIGSIAGVIGWVADLLIRKR